MSNKQNTSGFGGPMGVGTPAALIGIIRSAPRRVLNATMAVVSGQDDRAAAQRNAIVAFTVRVMSAALLYLTQIVLARWMGGFEYGIYVFVWTCVLVLGGLSSLGLNLVVMRLVPEYSERGQLDLLRGLVFGTRSGAFLVGTGIAVLGGLGLWLFGSYVANYYVLPLYLALICVPIYALGDVQDGLGRGQAWMGIALIPPYVLRPLIVLASMVAAHELGWPMTATTAAGAAIFATWFSGLIQFALLRVKMSKRLPEGPRTFDAPLWVATAMPLFVINACELVLQNTDVLIVSTFLSPQEVGIYFAAAKTMSLIMFVHYAVGSAVAHRFSALNARGDRAGLEAFVRDAVNWTFWPSLAAAILLLALGRPLLLLFGTEFLNGYPVMIILVAGFLFRSAIGPSEFLLNMLGEQKACAVVLGIAAVLNVVLNLILVPAFGLLGAATATSIALVSTAIMQYLVVRSRLGLDVSILTAWRPAVQA